MTSELLYAVFIVFELMWLLFLQLVVVNYLLCCQTPGSEIDKGSEIDLHGHRGLLSSRVSVASHGSGGFSSKDNKTQGRRNSVASAAFSHCLLNLTQVV